MIDVNYHSEAPRIMYNNACFIRVCPKCGRFVSPDEFMSWKTNKWTDDVKFEPNATCKRHGHVIMPFEGWI